MAIEISLRTASTAPSSISIPTKEVVPVRTIIILEKLK